MSVTYPEYSDLDKMAGQVDLEILGGLHPKEDDKAPASCKTLILLGPGENFWNTINASQEWRDGHSDPIDRWSTRIITNLATRCGASAAFPFGGPPYEPFYTWAMRTGRIWSSPVKLAVHERLGLFVSFRGALLFEHALSLPLPPSESPCEACPKPCLTACPVEALTQDGYKVDTCHSFLDTIEGQTCMSKGCQVRLSCPLGQELRKPEQSAYHMRLFHKS